MSLKNSFVYNGCTFVNNLHADVSVYLYLRKCAYLNAHCRKNCLVAEEVGWGYFFSIEELLNLAFQKKKSQSKWKVTVTAMKERESVYV